MFSGIIAEVGHVVARDEGSIRVRGPVVCARTAIGGSIAVNGVCLTAQAIAEGEFSAAVMPETFRRTALGGLGAGMAVNLEPALAYGDPVGGHLVQGHVDGVGEVIGVEDEGNARWLRVRVPDDILRFCVGRGSIAIDGVSLTLADVGAGHVGVSLVPHTLEQTIARDYRPGMMVNLEVDVMARYVARHMEGR